MKYEIATEKVRWQYVSVLLKTNCSNKERGHYYKPASKTETAEIRKQHPRMVVCIWVCIYCGKVKQSM